MRIYRQNAIEGVKELFACADIGNDECDITYMLENLPSADRPTGNWVRLEREENVYDLHGVPTWGVNYMCDKCGFITTAIQDHFEQYKFCPHCGKRLVIER